jgi:IS30 family transposase
VSITSPTAETDDDVHFGVAARALGVSRKTVERMVKRGQLERGPTNAPAMVSKRSLVAVLEQRRRDVSHLTRATEIEQTGSGTEWLGADSPQDQRSALREVLVPVLAPLLDEFVAVRTRAAVLESQLASIKARAEQERKRDELMLALATRGWWARRKTRKAVLRHYIVGDDPSDSGSETD